MKTLLEYIEQLKTKHDMRIKIACDVSDEMMDKIERHLEKYETEKVSAPSKTILQKRPLDFPNLEQAEIHIIDFTCELPVSGDMLRNELASLLNLPDGHIVVRGQNDAREEEIEEAQEEKKEDYKAKTGADYDKNEASDKKADELSGDKYNNNLLKELKKLSDEKKKELKNPKIVKDPDVKVSGPEIGDSKATNKVSPVAKRGPAIAKK